MLIRSTVKGQIVIPVSLRKKFGITEKTQIQVYEEDGRIILQPITREYIRQVRGMLKGTRLPEVLQEERAIERRKEEEKLARWPQTESSTHQP
jgi:antitoxin PrlF